MKKNCGVTYWKVIVCVLGWWIAGGEAWGQQNRTDLQFDVLALPQRGPGNEVRQVFQDKEGYIWMATNNGLLRYDGYDFITYKSNLYHRHLLTDNTVQALAEDHGDNLWIGTANGLNVLHKPTGKIRKVPLEKFNNNFIQSLLVTKEGKLWVGTGWGLYVRETEQDSFRLLTPMNMKGEFRGGDIKSLIEDSRGQIWIGTWSMGLFRYDPGQNVLYAYPVLNPQNSAHVIFEDSRGIMWVGSWGYGLYQLVDPYDPERVTYINYRHRAEQERSLLDDIIYSLSEDLNTRSLWVGSRGGLSVLEDVGDSLSFANYVPGEGEHSLVYNEVNSIVRDRHNTMWLGLLGGGVCRADSRKRQFNLHRLEAVKRKLTTNSVRSILQDDEGKVWLGIGSYGLVMHDREKDNCTYFSDLPDFRGLGNMPTINTMLQRRNKELWFGTYGDGIYVYNKQAPAGKRVQPLNPGNCPWLLNGIIYYLLEDSHGNVWIGTKSGVNVVTPAGETFAFGSFRTQDHKEERPAVICIAEDKEGNMWFGTNRNGIFRLMGNFREPEQVSFREYSTRNGKIFSDNISCLYSDSQGRLWAGAEGEGLVNFDAGADMFRTVQRDFRLPGDGVYSMTEDRQGYLWLGTSEGLVRLTVADNPEGNSVRLFTTIDGLQDNAFTRNVVYKSKNGEMFFGGHNGYNSFYPELIRENQDVPSVVITDIKVFNRSWSQLKRNQRERISTLAPGFTRRITLSHRENNFNIDFAVLSYGDPSQNKYAYQLEGFDPKWEYTDASRRFAYYNNLKSGTYRFAVKGTNEHGSWSPSPVTLEIVVLPAPWATWWAYVLYIIAAGAIVWGIFKVMHHRLKMETAVKLAEMKQQKSEEMNHAKLQFFTNITHELMTPLTIISASLDELKLVLPSHTDYYEVLSENTRRLMRLIQQILEFRKAESGNLKLKVSYGNLSRFVKNSVESFRPLIRKKNMTFTLTMGEEDICGYFDPDKMDKIVYNLLSNAAKYNKENSAVEVCLAYEERTGMATFSVKDHGEGISPEAMKTLFKRFYEGNYRRFNTVGTGIGLSLTKDLVDLHRGTIRVESEKGKGAMFIVTVSLLKEAYDAAQVDEEMEVIVPGTVETTLAAEVTGSAGTAENAESAAGEDRHTLLLVEDNEELLQLMSRLLMRDYRVVVARNGREGIAAAGAQEIDLIVSDVMMPEVDGIELCKYIKNKFELCHIPVILLTAKQSEEDKITGYNVGADSYLTKPFSLSLLQARIKGLLRNRERTAREFKEQMVVEPQVLNYTSMDEAFMEKALACVYRHLDDTEFDTEQLSQETGVSKSTLYNKLKSLTGLHTSAFIRNVRLKAACRLMQEKKKIRISELAYAVGFNDAKYFSTCFKKEFGMLPSEYMEKYSDVRES